MHALTHAPDMELSVRSRRTACVLDPALLLSAPQSLLLARQLSSVVDVWLCPGLWRLLDASEFFLRSPDRLARWLGLPEQGRSDAVGRALTLCSHWRASHDVNGLGMYWVGLHQTESFLPEHGPRDLPTRFEALMTRWQSPAPDDDRDAPLLQGNQLELAQECAALSAALEGAPVLTLAGTPGASQPPLLTRQWAEQGLPLQHWPDWLLQARQAEQQHWWTLLSRAGATATVATGLNLSVAQVIAPMAHFLPPGDPLATDAWSGDTFGDAWPAETPTLSSTEGDPLAGWWQQAQALWFNL